MPQSSFSGRVGSVMNMSTFSIGIADPPGGEPGPTVTRPWFSISNPGGLTGFEQTQNEVVGYPFDAHRVFDGAFRVDPSPLLQPEIQAGRVPIYSTKPPTVVSQYPELAENLANLGGLILASVDHEPENSMSAAQFEDNYLAFHDALKDVPNVWVGPIYMAVTSTSTTRAEFRALLDTMPMDWIGVDGYNSQNKRSFGQIFNWYALKARERGIPWCVAEWSTHGTPEQRAAHVATARAYWEDPVNADLLFVSWFDSDGGNRAGPSGWRIDHALPEGWIVVDGIAQAAAPPPEYVIDTVTPVAIHDALAQTVRRTIGQTDPPPDAPDPLQQGALPLGDAVYPIPATGVAYVDPGGSSTAAGGETTPVNTVSRALQVAGPNGTVVMKEGTYRERLWVNPFYEAFTIQNAPGAEVWWCGSVVVPTEDWIPDGGDWRIDGWPLFKHDVTDMNLIEGAPLAAWPYQVFRDGASLPMVATRAEVAPGNFAVVEGASTASIYVGNDPAGHLVEVSRLQEALIVNSPATIRGIGFKHYAPSTNSTSTPMMAPCRSHADNVTWENCHFVYNSAAGLHSQGNSGNNVRMCTFTGNGQMGLRGYRTTFLNIHQNAFLYNNTRDYPGTGAAGAMKIDSDSIGCSVRGNLSVGNLAHGLWLDIYDHYSHVIGNLCLDSDSSAIFWELSTGCFIIGNICDGGNEHGILVSEASSTQVWNNTLIDFRHPITTQAGGRATVDTMTARNNIVIQNNPPASAIVFTGVDNGSPGNGRSAETMKITYDNDAVWRRAPAATSFAQASLGGARVFYADRAAADASALNWEANGMAQDNTATNPYIDLVTYLPITGSPVIKAGAPLPGIIGDLLGYAADDPRRATPNIGAIL